MPAPTVLDTLAALIRINSVNPAYHGGVPEEEIARYIEGFFAERSIRTWRQEVFPRRPNVIAAIPGRDSSRRLVFEAHMDTASVEGMTIPPLEPRREGGRMYGRGSCVPRRVGRNDGSASLRGAEGKQPPCEIWLAAAADEEFSYRGVVKLREGLTAAGAVVSEPTEMRLITATKGCVRFKVHTHGKAAHSSKPHLGVNAVSAMARVILAIEKYCGSLAGRSHPLLGAATCNIGLISGGTQINVVPENCTIEIDRRLLPGETPAGRWTKSAPWWRSCPASKRVWMIPCSRTCRSKPAATSALWPPPALSWRTCA
jgi:acetylornithine deacetylase